MATIVMRKHCVGCEIIEDRRDAKLWREHGPALVKALKYWIAADCLKYTQRTKAILHARGASREVLTALAAVKGERHANDES